MRGLRGYFSDLRPWAECLGEPVLADANRFVHVTQRIFFPDFGLL